MKVAGEQCPARSRQTGEQCKRRTRGGGVCRYHGGAAPQTRRKREERLTLAKALLADPRRDPGEVLADVVHQSDHLMRKAREEVDAGQPTADTMGRLLELSDQAGRWAKTSLDAEIDQRRARVDELLAGQLAACVQRILDRLQLSPAQLELVPVVVVEEFERLSPKEITDGR